MDKSKLILKVKSYLNNLPEEIFDKNYLTTASVFLSGSTGWVIKEGFDEIADWDLHIILDNISYEHYKKKYGEHHVIDDQQHQPKVFAQIRSISWLDIRLQNIQNADCTYLWIYNNALLIQDNLHIEEKIDEWNSFFKNNIEEILKYHFVTFAVRRLDAVSAIKRNTVIGTNISKIEMIKEALIIISLLHQYPYPYNKWMEKYVLQLGEDGEKCVELCKRCIFEINFESNARVLKNFLVAEIKKQVCNLPWLDEWWKYNENPPVVYIR